MRAGIKAGLAILLVVVACGEDQTAVESDPQTNDAECAEHNGFTVVWRRGISGTILEEGRLKPVPAEGVADSEGWVLEQSEFLLISAYWSRTPNAMLVLDPSARSCVNDTDQWIMLAQVAGYPKLQPTDSKETPDFEVWEKMKANPWRFVRWGPVGVAQQQPEYQGVVRFTDELAVTSAACDTRPNIIRFLGRALAPEEFPVGRQTMVCVPPPGHEPLPDEPGAMWDLPISGIPSFAGSELVITDGDTEFHYVAISMDDYLAEFERDSFFEVDPVNPLAGYEKATWEQVDTPDYTPASTTTSAAP